MRTPYLIFIIILPSVFSFGQSIQTEAEANLIMKIVDQQTNLKDFVIAPTTFNNRGQTFAGKFSYRFIYDTSTTSLVKIQITDTDTREIKSMYFRNDQLVIIASKKDIEYFFDSDFDIPYWGTPTSKQSIQRDKYKETAYRLLITFKKYYQKNAATVNYILQVTILDKQGLPVCYRK